ncbi:hypothetical protein ACXJY6_10875 [Vibrio sp. RC27]
MLVLSSNAFADETLNNNFVVSYDFGSISGSGVMDAEPDFERIDKILAPTVTVEIGDTKLTNPTYYFGNSQKTDNSSTCVVSGAGEFEEFVWLVGNNGCSEIEMHPLSKDELNICGVSIKLLKR